MSLHDIHQPGVRSYAVRIRPLALGLVLIAYGAVAEAQISASDRQAQPTVSREKTMTPTTALDTPAPASTSRETGVEDKIHPFRAKASDADIAELRRRLAATRWPTKELVEDRSQGVQLATMKELVRYWSSEYDWRKAEARLNALPQFTTRIDGADIHFIHIKSRHENALPLIVLRESLGNHREIPG